MRSECKNSCISTKKSLMSSIEHSFRYFKASCRRLSYINNSSLWCKNKRHSFKRQNLQKEVKKNFLFWCLILIFCIFSQTLRNFSSKWHNESVSSFWKFMKNFRKFVKFFQTKPIRSWLIISISSQRKEFGKSILGFYRDRLNFRIPAKINTENFGSFRC